MAKPKRTAPKSKPVTQHQLFPAVVALWFGALFGLGSLAVRPTLLEELVIKSRIDLLIPAAAPPLGMTARMVVALTMAALGAILGTAIARRLARPKHEPRERKRTTLSTRDEGGSHHPYGGYAEASTRNPGPSQAETGAGATPGVLAGRRRSLAIEHAEDDFVPHDMAPLPGGAPQIFDIAAAGLNDAPAFELASAEPASQFEQAETPAPAPVALDWANAAPLLPPVAAAVPTFAQPAPADERQVFGMVPPATPPVDQPRQIFGAPVTDDHVPREFVESQGFRSSVFATPEPSPLFAGRAEAEPESVQAPPPPALPEIFALPVAAAIATPPEEPATIEESPEPALPSPASLGIEDLSARLAESMRRRRTVRGGNAAVAAPEPVECAEVPQFFATEAAEPAEPVVALPPDAQPAPAPIPAGLRPLDLTGFEEDDTAASDSLLPPRLIAFPAEPLPQPAAIAMSAPPVAAPVEDEPEVIEDAELADENYASLLAVTPSPASLRNPFVRVEETEVAAVEPVVIFPGQAVPVPQPFKVSAATEVEAALPFRRFDAPASAGQGQPIAANESASALPPEETERALRSALANLQRMSGAA